MTNKKYRNQLKELVGKAKDMYEQGKYKNPEYGELCMAVVRLIEDSDFGRKEAESELVLEVKKSLFNQMLDESFDGAAMQLLNMASEYLGRFGEVSMEPYSQGLATRSARVKFKPNDCEEVK